MATGRMPPPLPWVYARPSAGLGPHWRARWWPWRNGSHGRFRLCDAGQALCSPASVRLGPENADTNDINDNGGVVPQSAAMEAHDSLWSDPTRWVLYVSAYM